MKMLGVLRFFCLFLAGGHQTVYVKTFLSFQHSAEVLGVKLPLEDDALQRVGLDGVLDGGSLGAGVRVARDECPDRSECYEREYHSAEYHQAAHDGDDETGSGEPYRFQLLVRLGVKQR